MPEPTRADSYFARLQGLMGLGSSATEFEVARSARERAEKEALEAMKNQARMMQQTQYNIKYPTPQQHNFPNPGVQIQGGGHQNHGGVHSGGNVNINGKYNGGGGQNIFTIFPVQDYRISSKYGPRKHPVHGRHSNHTGMDFATKQGTPIYAVADGRVRKSAFDRIYGNQAILDFGGGIASMYGHMQRSIVKPGQSVRKGQVIGYVGSTGRSTGPHLHFETWVNNKPVNPLSWFRWN